MLTQYVESPEMIKLSVLSSKLSSERGPHQIWIKEVYLFLYAAPPAKLLSHFPGVCFVSEFHMCLPHAKKASLREAFLTSLRIAGH